MTPPVDDEQYVTTFSVALVKYLRNYLKLDIQPTVSARLSKAAQPRGHATSYQVPAWAKRIYERLVTHQDNLERPGPRADLAAQVITRAGKDLEFRAALLTLFALTPAADGTTLALTKQLLDVAVPCSR